jgi:Tripartite tricarboxylate transporter family receptor
VIVPFAAGGTTDFTARLIAQRLSERFGQQFVVENRPGASTNIATQTVIRATADGYTLLLVTPPAAINATLYKDLPFNVMRDIAPIASIMRAPYVMDINPSLPATTVPEFIAYAKANPGKISMASAGAGTGPHLTGELLKMAAGIDMAHVPYRGGAPALNDLMAGQVQIFFASAPETIEFIKAGKVRALAVTSASRAEVLAHLPTLDAFVPGVRGELLDRAGRAEKYASRNHRQPQSGDKRGARRPDAAGAASRIGRHRADRLARRLRPAHRRANGEVGQGREVHRNKAGVIGSTTVIRRMAHEPILSSIASFQYQFSLVTRRRTQLRSRRSATTTFSRGQARTLQNRIDSPQDSGS